MRRAGLAGAGVQVLHIVGPKNAAPADAAGGPGPAAPYVRLDYCDRMDLAYAAADLALCRAGMTTCAELTVVGLPAAYVPLPIGNGEQRMNAEPDRRGRRRHPRRRRGLHARLGAVDAAAAAAGRRTAGGDGRAAAALGRPDADERLADLVLQAAGRQGRS